MPQLGILTRGINLTLKGTSSSSSWFRAPSLVLNNSNSNLCGATLMPLLNARDLTDLQWAILDPLIPEPLRREDGRGRPWRDRRAVLNGILWVLRTGALGRTYLSVIRLTRRAT